MPQNESDGLQVSSSSSSRSSSYASTASSDVVEASPDDLDRPLVLPDILSVVPLGRSVEHDLLRMVGVPAPATRRADLALWAAKLTEAYLVPLLGRIQRSTPCNSFAPDAKGTERWDDATAIGLYTADAPVYRLVNGYLSEPNTVLRDVSSVAPMVRRIYEAVQRLGTPYSGPAYRVIKACKEEGSAAMQLAYKHFSEYFAVGKSIDMKQFASFTKTTTTVNAFAKQHKVPVIVLACGAVDGFDISRYSMLPDESEVLCLPPGRFTVLNPPILVGTTVVVGVETLANALRRRRAAPVFASSLGPTVAATSCEPTITRDALLHDAEAGLDNSQHLYVLQGPKGVGKTHLACRVGQRWLARGGVAGAQQHHVRWFAAASRELVMADYRTFVLDCFGADALSGRTLDDLQPAVRRLVASTPNMLLIFDGVEDEAVVEQLLNRLFMIRGSAAPNLHVLITSSSSAICDTGTWVALQGQHRKEIPAFTDAEVTIYLAQALPQRPEDVTTLQHSPLFRTHVHNHPKRLQWLSALLRNNPAMTIDELEACVAANVSRGTVDPVFTLVVDALIAQCAKDHSKGWEMLRLAAQLADAPIPVQLLRESIEITDDEADDAIRNLTSFSLVTLTFPAGYAHEWTIPCVVLHSLAREEATRYDAHYTTSSNARSTPTFPFMAALTDLLSAPSMGLLCYPHATHFMSRRDASVSDSAHQLAAATLLSSMGLHKSNMGQYGIALTHEQEALRLALMSNLRPESHADIANHLGNIGLRYGALGNPSLALQYALQALEMHRMVLPDPHPDIATSLNNIGNCYGALGDHRTALHYALEALEMERKVVPDEHPDIAMCLNNIGSFYSELGDHRQALQYSHEALDMQRRVLPDPDSNIAKSLTNLGLRYSNLGNHGQALHYAHEALEMQRKVLPDPHPDIASSLSNIGNCYSALGDHDQALRCAVEGLDMQRKVLPDEHPDIACSLNYIGIQHCALGNHRHALQFTLEGLEMQRKVLPNPHPDIANSLNNIAIRYSNLGDHRQALPYALEGLEMLRKILPDPHPDIASSLSNIGNCYSDLGDCTLALEYALEALEMRRKVFAGPHLDIACSLNYIGIQYSGLGYHTEALHFTLEGLEMQRKVLPEPHPDIANSISILGIRYSNLGDSRLALKYALEALDMQRKILPDPHPDIAHSLNNIGNCYSALSDYTEALHFTLQALEMERKLLPAVHPDIASSLTNLGIRYSNLGDHNQALLYGLEGLEMQRKVLPDPHQNIVSSLGNVGTFYCELGDDEQALHYALEALGMLRKLLPDPHSRIAFALGKIVIHCNDLGDYRKALQFALQALEMERKLLPAVHPDIANSLGNIGTFYGKLCEHEQALQYALEALDMQRKILPDPHPDIAHSLNNIGTFYGGLGDHRKALQYALQGLEMRRKVLPDHHPHIARSLKSIGSIHSALGDHGEALHYELEALEMERRGKTE